MTGSLMASVRRAVLAATLLPAGPPPPVPSFTVDAGPYYVGTETTLTDTSSGHNPAFNVWEYSKDNGAWQELATGTGTAGIDFAGSGAGSYRFRLTVTGDDVTGFGTASVVSSPVAVYVPAVAAISPSAGPYYVGEEITLTDDSTGDYDPAQNFWEVKTPGSNFGGMATGGTSQPYTPIPVGDYEFRLTITGDGGTDAAETGPVAVNSLPSLADAGLSPAAGSWQTGVEGTSSPSGTGGVSGYTFEYDWGEGGGYGAAANHTYATAGNYNLTIRVTDSNGRSTVASPIAIAVTDP